MRTVPRRLGNVSAESELHDVPRSSHGAQSTKLLIPVVANMIVASMIPLTGWYRTET